MIIPDNESLFESQIMMEMLNTITIMYEALANAVVVTQVKQRTMNYEALANAVVVSQANQRIIQLQVIKCKEMIEALYEARREP